MNIDECFAIGDIARRTGAAPSALRYYESEGLIHSMRSSGGQRRYSSDVIRRVSFIRVAQQVGLSLDEVKEALSTLPDNRTPNKRDWERLSKSWTPRLDEQIATLERLRDRLVGCIGCGCLSLKACHLHNPGDQAGEFGPGPQYVLHDR